jgi:hypothetical protein
MYQCENARRLEEMVVNVDRKYTLPPGENNAIDRPLIITIWMCVCIRLKLEVGLRLKVLSSEMDL